MNIQAVRNGYQGDSAVTKICDAYELGEVAFQAQLGRILILLEESLSDPFVKHRLLAAIHTLRDLGVVEKVENRVHRWKRFGLGNHLN